MAKNLVIVESPAKAKTIEKYLGKDFSVKSSMGHIRDIPSKGMNIDLENNFEPHYEITASKKKTVAGKKDVLDAIRSLAPGFIFTTGLSPVICAGALTSVKYVKEHNDLREKLHERSKKTKHELEKSGIKIVNNNSHIVPVIIGDAIKCKKISDDLLYKENIYVQPINYPTVAEGTERLRFTPSPLHTDAMILNMVAKLKKTMVENLVFEKNNVININIKAS